MSAAVEITLEQPGVIVISETLRKQLGLVPGMSLVVEEAPDGVHLRVKARPSHLQYENHVLVYTGEIVESKTDPVLDDCEERMVELMQ